ncbi:hypothetical protein NW759_017043 [Fusarium solani]|uniref:Uncharacterized protein n=1 Tax=Fusarium falciforme TaxID=195108 RepID=A0A9W8QRF9_9HYPO|nr:hypothetical protein NW755_014423 [Fusarium falciforme]KAJ4184125.1 hypothetical protein NW759_017043 [Fusarium solani]
MDRLAAYIAAANLAPREAEIRALVAQGAQDVRAIMTSPYPADELRRDAACQTHPDIRNRQATGIMWYLTALAVEHNQGFVRGAFVCRDTSWDAPGCTGGVDLRATDTLPPLAHGLRHVLFIAIVHDKRRGNCLLLKPEPYDVAGVLNFARRRRFGGNDGVGMRKERIPDRLVQDFGEAVVHLPDGASAIAEVGRRGEGDGIGCMHDYLVTKLADANISESSRAPLTTLMRQLESEYDFAAFRFGNEVFLDLATDLASPLPLAPEVLGPSRHLWWLHHDIIEERVEQEMPLEGPAAAPTPFRR